MLQFYEQLLTALADGEPFALGIICGIKGSSPQKKGAKALFFADGRIVGTLGGGCLEAEIQDRARRALLTGQPATFDLVLDHDFGWDDGLICGGKVQGVILPRAAEAKAIWREVARRETTVTWGVRTDFSIDWVDQSASQDCGEKDLSIRSPSPQLSPGRGGATTALAGAVSSPAFEVQSDAENNMGFSCDSHRAPSPGGEGWGEGGQSVAPARSPNNALGADDGKWLYQETVSPPCALWIAGSGHVAQAVAPIALQLDFEVTVFDDRPTFASRQFFPEGTRLRVGGWEELLREPLPRKPVFGLVVTRGHQRDALVLAGWIQQPFAFLGMIGSRRKARLIFDQFIDEKIASKEQLAEVACPVGLDIDSRTVPEIAVSIAAQLIQRRSELLREHGERGPQPETSAPKAASLAAAGP
jgi:xanthine dehydrogenase accessory factor